MRKILENGITLRICDTKNSDSVCLLLKLSGGAAWESASNKGITHLVEHLCFRRSRNMTQREFYYKIERCGGYLRGATYRDCVIFEITVLKKHLSETVNILRGMFDENGWTYEDIRREKQVVLRQLENSGDITAKQLFYDFFCKSRAGECILGTQHKMLSFTKAEILNQKALLFNPCNAELIVTGNITSEDVQLVEAVFSNILSATKNCLHEITPSRFLSRTKKDFHDYEEDSDRSIIAISFDVDTETVSRLSAELLHCTLGQGLLSPFSMRLREELGILAEIESGCEFYNFGGIMYFIFEVCKNDSNVLKEELQKIFSEQKTKLDKYAFECAKASFSERELSVSELAYILAFNDDIVSHEEYIARVNSLKYEDVCSAAKNILSPSNVTVNLYNL
ncbi:MAG: insulinase family protein [Oscillospiraceae bacterium]|nr:insulinase family protein [Oscillospiraceae bacterium]